MFSTFLLSPRRSGQRFTAQIIGFISRMARCLRGGSALDAAGSKGRLAASGLLELSGITGLKRGANEIVIGAAIALRCLVTTAALLFALCCQAQGQTPFTDNFRIGSEVLLTSGHGYQNPAYGLTLGASKRINDRWSVDLSARALRARKIEGDGYNLGGGAEVRWLAKTPSTQHPAPFLTAGLGVSRQSTDFFTKTATNAVAGAGVVVPLGRNPSSSTLIISGRYALPDFTSLNKSQGVEGRLELYKQVTSSWGFYHTTRVGVDHFKCIQTAQGLSRTCNGVAVSFRFGVYFHKDNRSRRY